MAATRTILDLIPTGHRDEYLAPSTSKPGETYLVRRISGDVRCTCPASSYGAKCWHKKVLEGA